ncbi:nuclear speckle splicing regulatory protein 1 [Choristoneura fumiferana]|uniref:nuclear speckle splicing regulatory protein 1 n=1 Tax=Choristoneura fumiferana TaxID=7141 RepID=UPI003D153784
MSGTKKYGLILPEKAKASQPKFQASRNVFGDDSDSDDNSSKKPVLLKPSDNTNRQAKITQSKAIEEDPTIYQYDEIYDSMTSKKEEKKLKTKELKQPKYIENLLKTANKRKIENERRLERQIQKEREKEGDEFADKEVFVTSAYKKKLEDLRLEEEKEQREEYLESIGDVTKQRDLGGFYRHLYEQKLGSDKNTDSKPKSEEKEDTKLVETFKSRKVKEVDNNSDTAKKRSYRKRKVSDDNDGLSEGEIQDSDEEINRVNLADIKSSKKVKQNVENPDADSDFSIDSSSEDDDTNSKEKTKSSKDKDTKKNVKNLQPTTSLKEAETSKVVPVAEDKVIEVAPEPKPKIDIWKKRTVGDAFDQALKRYYERKAAKG